MSSHDFEPRPNEPQVPVDSGYRGFDADATTPGRTEQAAESLKGPARDVKDTAVSAGRDVVDSAKFEAGQVAREAKYQGRRLLDEGVGELRSQANTLQAKLADTVDALTEELGVMSANTQTDGPLTQFAGDAHDWGRRASSWLRDNDPDQVMGSVRRYAARNPWTFLAIAAGAGLVVGRLARGLKDSDPDDVPQLASDTSGYHPPSSAAQGYALTTPGEERLGEAGDYGREVPSDLSAGPGAQPNPWQGNL
ncbi:hypothetical protein GCM10025789_00700 [Tessaracoccus lubricantis]|uniref:DUF3618 domain-containing protein n=1 Tax=Tessaracoccus lubricantis TaxID=545543 RepID=A0ABP9EVX7_9ACTN